MSSNPLKGYILLNMPTDQIQPLSLLIMQNKMTANMTGASIDDLFEANEMPLPLISKNFNISSRVDQHLSLDVDVKSNLSFLEALLKYVNLSASFNFQKNKQVKINLLDAKKDLVNEFKLDAFINGARVSTLSKTFTELLEKNELFVVTDILKCKKYSVEYEGGQDISSGISAEADGVGGGTIENKKNQKNTEIITNENDVYLTIGIKAFRIFYVKDKKTGEVSYRIRNTDSIKTVLDDENFPGELLEAQNVLLK